MKNMIKAVGYLIYYVIFQMLIMWGIALLFAASNAITDEMQVANFINNHMLGFTVISNIASLLVLFLFFCVRKKKFFEEINLRKVDIEKCILPCFMAFCSSMAFALITYHMDFANAQQIADSTAYYSDVFPCLGIMVQIAALLIAAPITEEIICRGLILTRIQRNFNDDAAVLLSGLLFGIIHLAAGGAVLAVGAFVMGTIFGIICVKTKSLLPAIISHSIANVPDFIIALLPDLSKGMRYFLIVLFLIVFFVLMYLFIKERRNGDE